MYDELPPPRTRWIRCGLTAVAVASIALLAPPWTLTRPYTSAIPRGTLAALVAFLLFPHALLTTGACLRGMDGGGMAIALGRASVTLLYFKGLGSLQTLFTSETAGMWVVSGFLAVGLAGLVAGAVLVSDAARVARRKRELPELAHVETPRSVRVWSAIAVVCLGVVFFPGG